MRDCYNRPRSESSRQPKYPADKEKMIEDALRHFRIIEYIKDLMLEKYFQYLVM